VAAFGRAYAIIAYSVTAPQLNGTSQWDIDGSPPDPYAIVLLNNQTLGMTNVLTDTNPATWNQATPPTVIPAGSKLEINVYDDDVGTDDGILACVLNPLSADDLHRAVGGQTLGCSGNLGTLVIKVTTN